MLPTAPYGGESSRRSRRELHDEHSRLQGRPLSYNHEGSRGACPGCYRSLNAAMHTLLHELDHIVFIKGSRAIRTYRGSSLSCHETDGVEAVLGDMIIKAVRPAFSHRNNLILA